MTIETRITRRHMVNATIGGASGAVAATLFPRRQGSVCLAADSAAPTKPKPTSTELAADTSFISVWDPTMKGNE